MHPAGGGIGKYLRSLLVISHQNKKELPPQQKTKKATASLPHRPIIRERASVFN
jgi:hypothetical protein